MVFPCERIHSREVVDSLIGLHFVETVYGHAIISPKNVPFMLLIVAVFVVLAVG